MKQLLTKNYFFNSPYLYGLMLLFLAGLSCFLFWGEVKNWSDIAWFDVFAEGGMSLLAVFWLMLLLRSRPGGRVTRMLALGLTAIAFAWSMDFVDEFIKLADDIIWHDWLEAVPITFALVLLSLGIYYWHQEELAMRAKMLNKERDFREHRLFDSLTPLGGAAFLKKQLDILIKESNETNTPLSLVTVDLDNFNDITRRYGLTESDTILRSVCQLLLLNLRDKDLLFRLVGNRFVVVLSNTSHATAKSIATDLQTAIASFSYRDRELWQRIYLTASVTITQVEGEDTNSVIKRLSVHFSDVKQSII